MKLTVKAALEMLQAMQALDSYQNGADKPTLYKYDGDTRLRIAIARRKLRAIQDDYIDARNAVLMELSDGKGELPAGHLEFAKRDREMQKAEVEIDVDPLPVGKFRLEDNPIPSGVLDMLGEFVVCE
jgi:hypothetical protein